MRARIIVSTTAALLWLGFMAARLSAQTPATVCKDGTKSAAVGKGACAAHGGVAGTASAGKKKSSTSEAKKGETKSEAKSKAPSASTAPADLQSAAKSPTAATDNSDAADAIAQCKDGTYWHSASRRGACSRHGGV